MMKLEFSAKDRKMPLGELLDNLNKIKEMGGKEDTPVTVVTTLSGHVKQITTEV